MKSTLIPTGALLAVIACGPPSNPGPADAGPDTRCGLDCAAQGRYGLLVDRCFEYSASQAKADPADLGVIVKAVEELEGGLKVLPLEYRQSGQIKMTDYLFLRNGDLLLARRSFLPGQSVTYKDASGTIAGVQWLLATSLAGENFSTTSQATIVGFGTPGTESTTYKLVLGKPTANELLTPLQTFDDGIQMLFSETPDHGVDTRRIFVPEVGFIQFATAFTPTTATAQPYRLQRIRDLGTADGGNVECGFGSP